jgi:hypothetical protein
MFIPPGREHQHIKNKKRSKNQKQAKQYTDDKINGGVRGGIIKSRVNQAATDKKRDQENSQRSQSALHYPSLPVYSTYCLAVHPFVPSIL